jgi:hypothetical protein
MFALSFHPLPRCVRGIGIGIKAPSLESLQKEQGIIIHEDHEGIRRKKIIPSRPSWMAAYPTPVDAG